MFLFSNLAQRRMYRGEPQIKKKPNQQQKKTPPKPQNETKENKQKTQANKPPNKLPK